MVSHLVVPSTELINYNNNYQFRNDINSITFNIQTSCMNFAFITFIFFNYSYIEKRKFLLIMENIEFCEI